MSLFLVHAACYELEVCSLSACALYIKATRHLYREQIGITHCSHGHSWSVGCHPEFEPPQQDGERRYRLKQRKLIPCTPTHS